MVGVCLTVIGIIKIVIRAHDATTLADAFLALDAPLFLTSCILAYWAMRKQVTPMMFRLERIAVICALIAFEVNWHESAGFVHQEIRRIGNKALPGSRV